MRHASLFSGIGGPEVAAEMMGWKNVFHCEINPFGRKVLEYWFPDSESYEDITKTDFTKYRGKIDILTGGFPCQPFSYAGKRGGQEDNRYLWQEMFRAIGEIRPAWVVGENVAGITTMVESCRITDLGCPASLFEEDSDLHEYRAEFTFTIERICKDLEDLGYSVQPMLIPAAAVGAPHRRDRVFIIAYAENTICNRCNRKPLESKRASNKREQRVPCSRSFQWFPTPEGTKVSIPRAGKFQIFRPICRANDGFPEGMDCEAIKAYGNAIVPQVMFRIFQAIESTYNNEQQ